MTSRRYLSDRKKGASYSFFSALKTSLLPGGILAGLYTAVFALAPFIRFYRYVNGDRGASGAVQKRNAKDLYKFVLFTGDDPFTCYALMALIAVISLILGIIIFRFASDKKTVNVYYSLGIKRTRLFYTRWFAGAIVLCAATAFGVIAGYVVNLAYVGLSWQLSVVLLYFYCGLSLFSLLIYTVTAAVFASVGTVSEGILYSAGVLGLPTALCLAAQNLISGFMSSSTYRTFVMKYALLDTDRYYTMEREGTIIARFAPYNPVLFFADALIEYGVGSVDSQGKVLIGLEEKPWHLPSLFAVLPWFFIVVAFALLGGLVFFRLRKAENCGFLNTNKPLGIIVLFELMFVAACLPVSQASYYQLVEILLVSALLALGAFIAYQIFIERNVKRFFKKFWKFPVFAAVIAGIFTVFITDAFHYESRIPDISDVTAVTLSLPLSYSKISLAGNYEAWQCSGYINNTSYWSGNFSTLPEISDPDTVKKVAEVHKKSIGQKDALCDIFVSYTLKSGAKTQRIVHIDEAQMKELFCVYDSKDVKAKYAEMLSYVIPEKATETQAARSGLSMFDYRYATVTGIAPNMLDGYEINLSKDEFEALKKAVLADLNALPAEKYYNAGSRQFGLLRFSTPLSVWVYDEQVEGVTSAVGADAEAGGFVPDTVSDYPDLPEEKSARLTPAPSQYTDFGGFINTEAGSFYDVLIDGSMVNTVKYLNSIGAGGCFTEKRKIKSVSFTDAQTMPNFKPDYDELYGGGSFPSREFFADSIIKGKYWDLDNSSGDFVSKYSENIITDAKKIEVLSPLMKMHAYHGGEGYFCLFVYEDGSMSVRFLKKADAPSFVTDFDYKGSAYDGYYG